MITEISNGLNILADDASCGECAELIQKSNIKFAVVCDAHGRLLGTVTDGDIRRAFLNQKDSFTPVVEVMNKNPTVLLESESKISLRAKMRAQEIIYAPKISQDGSVVGLLKYMSVNDGDSLPNTAVIMAGGRGERLRPLTNDTPKPLLEIGGKPALEHVIEHLAIQGICRFVISVNYLGSMIKDYFKGGEAHGVKISYLDETKPLGTAGCLSLLEKQSEPFFVVNGDVIFQANLRELLQLYDDDTQAIIGTRTYSHKIPFGCIEVQENEVTKISEKPEIRHLVSGGFYLLNPKVCQQVLPNTYLDMPQLITGLIDRGKKVQHHSIEGIWIDIGSVQDLEAARNLMSAGKLYD